MITQHLKVKGGIENYKVEINEKKLTMCWTFERGIHPTVDCQMIWNGLSEKERVIIYREIEKFKTKK